MGRSRQNNLPLEETRKKLYRCVFSDCGTYRYVLADEWDHTKGRVMFIGLNPSTADEYRLDPTLTRIRKWVESWGYGGFVMTNLFAFRSPHPEVMEKHPEPEGRDNNMWLLRISAESNLVVAAWGNHGAFKGRAGFVESLLSGFLARKPVDLYCLGKTADGFPIHPMARGKHRVPNDVQPQPYLTRGNTP